MTNEAERAAFEAEMDAADAEVDAIYDALTPEGARARLAEDLRAQAMSDPILALEYTMIRRAHDDPSRIEGLIAEVRERARQDGSSKMLLAASELIRGLREIAATQPAQSPRGAPRSPQPDPPASPGDPLP